jgi:hypothetical protein
MREGFCVTAALAGAQPYFKLPFCSLVAFGPDCSHFPSAIANMRENSARSVSAVCEACRGQADVNVDACPTPMRSPRSASGSAAAGSASRPGSHGTWPDGHARLWPRTAVGASTNGRDSSHLGEHSDHCRAQGPSWDSQPERNHNKGWCWRVPTRALAETSKRLARKSRTKALTPAHRRAMIKTLLSLIATFGVWLAPPEPPRPLLARQRDEHARHPAPWPAITPPALSRRSWD